MISKEELKKLEEIANKGRLAQEILSEHNRLEKEIGTLQSNMDSCHKCFRILYNNGYCDVTFHLRNSEDGATLIKQIMQMEINNIRAQIDKLKLE